MTALTAGVITQMRNPGDLRKYIVASGKTIYEGGQCFADASTGNLTDDGNSGANQFVGIAKFTAAAGETCEVWGSGDFLMAVTNGAQAIVGDKVYSDDSNGATTVLTSASLVGTAVELESGTNMWVQLTTHSH